MFRVPINLVPFDPEYEISRTILAPIGRWMPKSHCCIYPFRQFGSIARAVIDELARASGKGSRNVTLATVLLAVNVCGITQGYELFRKEYCGLGISGVVKTPYPPRITIVMAFGE